MSIINNQYISCYTNFINELKKINEYVVFEFDNETIFENEIKMNENLTDEEKISRGNIFNNILKNDDMFNLFVDNKYKIFHKENLPILKTCLLGEILQLDILLNNKNTKIKNIIWCQLYHIYISTELLKPPEDQLTERINILFNKINNKTEIPKLKSEFNKHDIKDNIYGLIGDKLNGTTKDIIDDIINSFDDIVINKDTTELIPNILNLGQKISDKYSNHIEKNDINLDQLLQVIVDKIPGISNIIPNLFKNSKKEEKQYIISENFSTADIQVGELEESQNNFKIGDILKLADSLGIMPNKQANDLTKNNSVAKDINIDSLLDVLKNLDTKSSKNKPSKNKQSNNKNIDINSLLNIMKNIDETSQDTPDSKNVDSAVSIDVSESANNNSASSSSSSSNKPNIDINSLLDVIKNLDSNNPTKNKQIKLNKKLLKSVKKY